jgi:FkbM family methyltransferase
MHSDLVFDIGMNNGDDTAYYLRRGYRVVAVEADPAFIRAAEQRFRDAVAAGRLTLVNAAIGGERGSATFHFSQGNRGVWNSFDPAIASRGGLATRTETIECVRFADLLAEHGTPYYLKVDIEGADHYCLADLDPDDLPQYVSFEASEGKLADLYHLAHVGYTRFKLIDQLDGFREVVPPPLHSPALARVIATEQLKRRIAAVPGVLALRRALTGRPQEAAAAAAATPPEFPVSSSGPMGEDTHGQWRTVDEVAYAWLYYATRKDRANWYDVHATR